MKKMVYFCFIVVFVLTAGLTAPAAAAPGSANAQQGIGPDYAGGPDGFGYVYKDSLEATGPVFGWIDAVTGGTNLALDDQTEANITLPFSFTYYGTSSTAIRVGNNGAVLFGVTTGDLADGNACPLSGSTTNNVFGPWWDDWATAGDVYWQVFGAEPNRYVVIEWYNMAHYTAAGTDYATFELVLYEGSTDIIYQYQDVDVTGTAYDSGLSGTTGIRGSTAANTLQYRTCNSASLQSNLAVRYYTATVPSLDNSTKTAPVQALIGDIIPYSIHITNSGTAPANAATMSDAIPAGTTYVAGSIACSSGSCSYDAGNNQVNWSGSLAVGATAAVTFTVDTDAITCGSVVVNTATLDDPDLLSHNITKQASTLIVSTLPILVEGFELTAFPPAGWTEVIVTDPGTDPDWTRETVGVSPAINPHSGVAMTRFNSYTSSSGASSRLYTPAMDFTTTAAPALSFWMSHYSSSTNDRIQIQVSTDGGTTWTNVGAEIPRYDASCATACWKAHTQDLSAYAGQPGVMVGFLGISAYGYHIFIDDVKIAEPWSPCPYVSLGADQISSMCPGGTASYTIPVKNAFDTIETYDLSSTGIWPTSVDPASVTLDIGETGTATASVYVPWASQAGTSDTALINTEGQANGLTDQVALKTFVPLGNSWTDRTSSPHSLRMSSTVYYNGKLYTIGGYDGTARGYVDIYDIASNTWSSGTSLIPGTYGLDCVVITDKIYCAGGQATTTALNIYDIAGNSWSTGAVLPLARYYYAGVAYGGKYYVIGGYNGSVSVNTIYAYDPAANTWNTALPNMTEIRRYPSAGVINGKIYIAGGYSTTYLSSMEVFDLTTGTWAPGTAMPVPWLNAADAVIGDRFLVLAGGGSTSTSAQSNQAWFYDAVANNWSALPNLPRALYAAEADSDGTNFWMVGGYSVSSYINNLTRLERCASCTAIAGLDFTIDPASPRPGMEAAFTGSVASGTAPIIWQWDFGDEATATGQTANHTFTEPGTFTVTLTATNCDGVNVLTIEKPVIVMAGSLAVISPLSLDVTQCPECQTQQTVNICNDGDMPLSWAITETVEGMATGYPIGIDSLSGSFVAFDPTAGGDTEYLPGTPGTFCFRTESWTTDAEYRDGEWLKFPADWSVDNVTMVGEPVCDGGSAWGDISVFWENSPYEFEILHPAYQEASEHCSATYCVAATPGPLPSGDVGVSWYYDGDGYGSAPHHPCSVDNYTPTSQGTELCDEAINPLAVIPQGDWSPILWLVESPLTGTVAAQSCNVVDITFDSADMTPGVYTGTLMVLTNDVLHMRTDIPVTMTVAGPPTELGFTYDPALPIMFEDVEFSGFADSLTPVTYAWDFGDGITGTGQTASHAYSDYGDYVVSMSVLGCGDPVVYTATVTVAPCQNFVMENFEGAFPPTGWTVVNNGSIYGWLRNDQVPVGRPNYAGGQGFCADADSDRAGSSATMDTELRTFVIDLSAMSTAELSYVTAYNDIATGGDLADVDVSVDAGLTWTNLLRWDTDHSPSGPGEGVTLDLSAYTGYSQVMVRFHYYIATYDWWWEIDQVKLTACLVPGAVPDIDVTPTALTQTLHPNETATQTLTISNLGDTWLNWNLVDDAAWLSENPLSGTTHWASSSPADVVFNSSGLSLGEYTGTLDVLSDDPDEPTVTVDVTLIITGTPDIAVTPLVLDSTQLEDVTTTQQVSICNNGDYDLTWSAASAAAWLSELPTGGTVLPLDCVDVDVTFDSTGLLPGEFTTDLIIDSSDPDEPQITIPVTLTVIRPEISVEPLAISATLYPAQTATDVFTITNVGTADLTYNLVFTAGWLSFDHPTGTLVPGAEQRVTATFSSGSLAPGMTYTDDITVESNDPGTAPVVVASLTVTGDPDIVVDPLTLVVTLLPDETASETFSIGNVGYLNLTYTVSEDPAVDWLSEAPASGTVIPGGSQDVTVSFDSTGYSAGEYQTTLTIASNDPDQQYTYVDVTMVVQAVSAEWTIGPGLCFDFTRLDAEYYPANGLVYVLGGRGGADGTVTYGDIYSFDPVTGVCADTGDDMLTPISNYTINLVNNGTDDVLCTMGGRDQAGTMIPDIQCYNPLTGVVTVAGDLPAAFDTFLVGGQIVLDNQVYLFGGFQNVTAPYHIAVSYRWDPVANTFTQLGDLSMARGYMDVAVVDGKIYAFGGNIWDGTNLVAQTRTEVMADPAGAGTWDDAAVAELPTATAEGRAFGFDTNSPYDLDNLVVIAGGGQWPGDTPEGLVYDVATDSYDYSFADLNVSRRNHAGVLVPIVSEDPTDGLPGMWVFGGRSTVDTPPFAPAEFFPLVGELVPDIGVSPASLAVTLSPDQMQDAILTINNNGFATLNFDVDETPLVDWLSEAPVSGSVEPGLSQEVVVTFDSTGLVAGEYTADLVITSDDPDTPEVIVPVTLTVTEQQPSADLAVTLVDSPDPVVLNGQITYTLNVVNHGPDAATDVVVTAALDPDVTFVSAPGCTYDSVAHTVTCLVDTMAVDDQITIAIVVTAPNAPMIVTTDVEVASAVDDPDLTNNTASADTNVVEIFFKLFLPIVMKQ